MSINTFSIINVNNLFMVAYLIIMGWMINKYQIHIRYVNGVWNAFLKQSSEREELSSSKINHFKFCKNKMIAHITLNSTILGFCWFVGGILFQVTLLKFLPYSILNMTVVKFPLALLLILIPAIFINGFLANFKPFVKYQIKKSKLLYLKFVLNEISKANKLA